MELGLKGRVAIVTGASKGIGRAIALELAAEGCDLAICARGIEDLNKVREQVESRGVRCIARHVDITQPADIDALVCEVKSNFGRLDILVNNAGGARPGTFASLSDRDFLYDYELEGAWPSAMHTRGSAITREKSGSESDQYQRDSRTSRCAAACSRPPLIARRVSRSTRRWRRSWRQSESWSIR